MRSKNRSVRRPLPVIQLLDARYFFAVFHAADYNPSGGGNSWEYSVVQDGQAGEDSRTSSVSNGQLTLSDSISGDFGNSSATTTVSLTSAGVAQASAEVVEDDVTTKMSFGPGFFEIPATFGTGVVQTWSDEKGTVTVSSDKGIFKGTVTESGTLTVDGMVADNTEYGPSFPQALKFVAVRNLVTKVSGSAGKITLDQNITTTSLDVKNLGTVFEEAVTKSTTVGIDGTTTKSTHDRTLSLNDSNLSPVHIQYNQMTLTGTDGNDDLEVRHVGKSIVAVCNDYSESYPSKEVLGVEIMGGGGNDKITVDPDVALTYANGGEGNDYIIGSDGRNILTGGAGNDTLYGNGDNDRLNGDGGNDFLYGGGGNDRLYGIGGNDTLNGGGGFDSIDGGSGNDSLIGGSAIDSLYGESGNDTLQGQSGADLIDGGSGTDSATVEAGIDSVANVENATS